MLRHIFRAGMAICDGRVFVQQQLADRFTDNIASSDYNNFFAGKIYVRLFNNSTIPCGVHGRNVSSPSSIFPTLRGWKPSTSLSGEIRSITAFQKYDPEAAAGRECRGIPDFDYTDQSLLKAPPRLSESKRSSLNFIPIVSAAFSCLSHMKQKRDRLRLK